MSTLCIRPALVEDLPAIKAIIDANALFPSELLDGMFTSSCEATDHDEYWLLAVENSSPVAVAYYAPEPMTFGTWNVLLIAVHPDKQGQGTGSGMLEQVEQHLGDKGERVLLIETSGTDDFARTRQFYTQRGYAQEARIRDYYDVDDDKIIFRKALNATTSP